VTETSSLILRDEHRLRMFDEKELRRISRLKKDELIGY
jgi:hypothetical protein